MQLSAKRKMRLAATGSLVSVSFLVYMLSGSGPIGPPYKDESLTAGPELLRLVEQPSVRDELKLSEAQVQQIHETAQKQAGGRRPPQDGAPTERAARMGRKHQETFLAQVLQPAQMARLRQIILQRQGGLALNSSQAADSLALTPKQREKTDAIVQALASQLDSLAGVRGPDARKQAESARAAAGEQMLGLLTSKQQGRWKELLGEPFTGEIDFRPPGSPGRGGPGGPPPGQ
jgi:hypothetical protein